MNKWSDGKSSITFEYFLSQKKITEDEFYNLPEEEQEKLIREYESCAW